MLEEQKNKYYNRDYSQNINNHKLSDIKLTWIFILYNILTIVFVSIVFFWFYFRFFYFADMIISDIVTLVLALFFGGTLVIYGIMEAYFSSNTVWGLISRKSDFFRYFEKKIIFTNIPRILIIWFSYGNSKTSLLFIGLPIAWDIMWILYFINSRKIKDYFDGNNYLRGSIYSGIVGIVKIYLEE